MESKVVVPGQPICALDGVEPGSGTLAQYLTSEAQIKDTPGPGRAGFLVATRLGKVVKQDASPPAAGAQKTAQEDTPTSKAEPRLPQVSVDPARRLGLGGPAVVPQENDTVLARVTRISRAQVNVEILVVEDDLVSMESGIGSERIIDNSATAGGSHAGVLNASNLLAEGLMRASHIGEGFKGIIRSQDIRHSDRDKIQVEKCFRPGDVVRAKVISLGDGNYYYLSTAGDEFGVLLAKSRAGYLLSPVDWQFMANVESGEQEERKCANPFKRGEDGDGDGDGDEN